MNVYLTSTGPNESGLYSWGSDPDLREYAAAIKVGSYQGNDIVSVPTNADNEVFLSNQPEYLATGTLNLAFNKATIAKYACKVEVIDNGELKLVTLAEAVSTKAEQVGEIRPPITYSGEVTI